MGKIMMNGKQYGVGGIEKAKDISYDNTSSGMSATNVQGAVDELKSGLTGLLSVRNTENLSSYTANSLISHVQATGTKLYIVSASGGNKLSDLPEVIAGTYVVIPDTYYIKLIFFAVNGKIYTYDGSSWHTNAA